MDAPVTILITHALPRSIVAVKAETVMFGNHFESEATFRADDAGTVNPANIRPIIGTYSGIDPMGLFWSMRLVGKWRDRPFSELASRTIAFRVENNRSTASAIITRVRMAEGIKRTEVRQPEIYGTSFMHSGSKRRSAVIVVGGSEGGAPEAMAVLVASHGFNTLALAYFGAGPLPKSLSNVPIEDVERAIAWLRQQATVEPGRIGILGGSKGAELALLSAARFHGIKAVVASKPSNVVFSGLFYSERKGSPPSSWSFRGVPLPYVNGKVPAGIEARISADLKANGPASYTPEYLAKLRNATNLAKAAIPVEMIDAPILLVSGDDDKLWPSSFMAGEIMRRLHGRNRHFADQWLHYPSAGHGIGEAFDAYSHSVSTQWLQLGGTTAGNARASDDSWPRIIAFLSSALR